MIWWTSTPEPGAHDNDGERHARTAEQGAHNNECAGQIHLNLQWWWEARAPEQEARDNDVRGTCTWTGSSWQWCREAHAPEQGTHDKRWWEVRAPEQGALDMDFERYQHLNRELITMIVRDTYPSWQWWWEAHATEQGAHDKRWWEVRAPEQGAHDMDGERYLHLNRELMQMTVSTAEQEFMTMMARNDLCTTQFISSKQLYILCTMLIEQCTR